MSKEESAVPQVIRVFFIVAFVVLRQMTCLASLSGFADFDHKARAGKQMNVVFFGASLTWGANASDPQLTSYRAVMARRFEAAYPKAHFHFWDAAIGGTGSQLGVFRLDRDVLRRKPDLVFLDFSANDDIYSADAETLASYESLVRRIILEGHAPVVQVIFPFQWNLKAKDMVAMKRRTAHLAVASAYHTGVGDAIALAMKRVESGEATLETIWPFDGVHPGNAGYAIFADAAWQGFKEGVKRKLVCSPPDKMLYADTYMSNTRVRISTLKPLPAGWKVGSPNLTSAYYDMLMSRWLDDEVIGTTTPAISNTGDTPSPGAVGGAPLRVKFHGTMVMLYGESTPRSCKYRVLIDGVLVTRTVANQKEPLVEFDAGVLGRAANGNAHHVQVLAQGLDPVVEHTLEIVPVFAGADQELRLESICVAGGKAAVMHAQ